jgi:hypothetical protein
MTGRTLAYSLLGGAAILTLLMLAWLAVSGARGGGIVLGLILLVVLAGPLAVAGVVVLQRQPAEAAANAAFTSKRRVLEADRLFRGEMAPELRQLARQPGLPGSRLDDLAADLERSSYDSPEWYDTVQLGGDDVATLKRYEDLVWDRVRSLRDHAAAGASTSDLAPRVRELEQALDQRRDLLVRGRRAPSAAPSVLLRAGEPAHGLDAIRNVAVGDAVTASDGTDHLVEGVATYFAEGQTWKLVHLVPSGPSLTDRWLYIGPAGLDLGLLEEVQVPPTSQTLCVDGRDLPRLAMGTATVDIDSRAGSARGVLVTFARYASDTAMGIVENWPEGARHAYAGTSIKPTDVEVWPATARSAVPGSLAT